MSKLLEALDGAYDVIADERSQRLRTMTPVIVQAWNAPTSTGASCDAVLPIPDQAPNGDPVSTTNSLISKRPVYYPGGGGWVVHYPLEAGDEVMAIAADRNTEAWALNREPGAPSNAAIPRWHDISDAAILAMQDRPRLPSPTPSGLGTDLLIMHRTGGVVLRCEPSGKVTITTSATVSIELDPDGNKVKITAPLVEVAGADDNAVKYTSLAAAIDAMLLAGVNAAGPGAANFSAATTAWNGLKTTAKSNKVKVGA